MTDLRVETPAAFPLIEDAELPTGNPHEEVRWGCDRLICNASDLLERLQLHRLYLNVHLFLLSIRGAILSSKSFLRLMASLWQRSGKSSAICRSHS